MGQLSVPVALATMFLASTWVASDGDSEMTTEMVTEPLTRIPEQVTLPQALATASDEDTCYVGNDAAMTSSACSLHLRENYLSAKIIRNEDARLLQGLFSAMGADDVPSRASSSHNFEPVIVETKTGSEDVTMRDDDVHAAERFRRAARDEPEYEAGAEVGEDSLEEDTPVDVTIGEQLEKLGMYLQHHKFYDFDRRFYRHDDQGVEARRQPIKEYTYQFPVPRLAALKPEVEKACNIGLERCIGAVHDVASRSSVMRAITGNRFTESSDYGHEPFQTFLEQFQFRATAAYFLCWYTMRLAAALRHFGVNCDGLLNRDFRTDDHIPFSCAFLSFCPDRCCGQYNGGRLPRDRAACLRSEGNPCRGIADGACDLALGTLNHDFEALRDNRINITCKCDEQRPGFVWNNHFELCVDEDECLTQRDLCNTTAEDCRNTVGDYHCTCHRGYHHVTLAGQGRVCERDPASFAALSIYEEDAEASEIYIESQEGLNFLEKIGDWFLSRGQRAAKVNLNIVVMALSVAVICRI